MYEQDDIAFRSLCLFDDSLQYEEENERHTHMYIDK